MKELSNCVSQHPLPVLPSLMNGWQIARPSRCVLVALVLGVQETQAAHVKQMPIDVKPQCYIQSNHSRCTCPRHIWLQVTRHFVAVRLTQLLSMSPCLKKRNYAKNKQMAERTGFHSW